VLLQTCYFSNKRLFPLQRFVANIIFQCQKGLKLWYVQGEVQRDDVAAPPGHAHSNNLEVELELELEFD